MMIKINANKGDNDDDKKIIITMITGMMMMKMNANNDVANDNDDYPSASELCTAQCSLFCTF